MSSVLREYRIKSKEIIVVVRIHPEGKKTFLWNFRGNGRGLSLMMVQEEKFMGSSKFYRCG